MRISDWSSDVCSSDLQPGRLDTHQIAAVALLIRTRQQTRQAQIAVAVAAQQGQARGLLAIVGQPDIGTGDRLQAFGRSDEHTSELQSLMRLSYAVFCLKKKNPN